MRLLIVDHHSATRKLIREMLAHRAMEIQECEDGESAGAVSVWFRPDFVVMDLHLPGIGGLEAIRRVLSGHPQARVIAMSHSHQPALEELARQSGACHFVRRENLFDVARYLGRCMAMFVR
jgi:two-component system, NarL family, invasion response regulator UvrY